MDCFTFADKVGMVIFGIVSSILLTILYFTLLFAIRIEIKQRNENIKERQKNRDE